MTLSETHHKWMNASSLNAHKSGLSNLTTHTALVKFYRPIAAKQASKNIPPSALTHIPTKGATFSFPQFSQSVFSTYKPLESVIYYSQASRNSLN
jgi:hypothetical protein